MKPRPISMLLIIPRRAQSTTINLQCRRNVSRAAFVPSLNYTQCHDWPRISISTLSNRSHLFLRYASSATASAPKASAPAKTSATTVPAKTATHTQALRPKWNEKLNPPTETYAPPLTVPPRKKGQNYASYLWSAGRAYITFYKTGVANVRWTARLAKQLREKAARSPQGQSILTRAEWQVTRRSRQDILRLPAFALILLVFGEWTPLLVMWLTPVVPEACRIPNQNKKDVEKIEKRRRERMRRLAMDAARLIQQDRRPGTGQSAAPMRSPRTMDVKEVESLDLFNLLNISSKLDAHSKFWDWLFITPPKATLRRAVQKKLAYLKKDDALIERDGGWQGLGIDELRRACIERGIDVLGKNETDLRKGLADWYGSGKK